MADHTYFAKIEPSHPDDVNAGPSEPIHPKRSFGTPDPMKTEPSDTNEESECNQTHINVMPISQTGRQRQQSSKHRDALLTPAPNLTPVPTKMELGSRGVVHSEIEIKTEPASVEESSEKNLSATPVKIERNASEQEWECKTKIKSEHMDSDVQISSTHVVKTTDLTTVKQEPKSKLPDNVLIEGTTMVLEVVEDNQNSAWQKTVHVERTVNGSYILKEACSDHHASTDIRLQHSNGAYILKNIHNQHTSAVCANPQSTIQQSTDTSTASQNNRVNAHRPTRSVINSTSKTINEKWDQNEPTISGIYIKNESNVDDSNTLIKAVSSQRTYGVKSKTDMSCFRLNASVPETLSGGVGTEVHVTSDEGIYLRRPSAVNTEEPQVKKSKAIKNCVRMVESSAASKEKTQRSPDEGRLPWTSWGGIFDIEPDLEDADTGSEEPEDSTSQDQDPVKLTCGDLPRGWSCELCPDRPKFETYAENFLHHESCHDLLPKTNRAEADGTSMLCCFCGQPAEEKSNNKRKWDTREPLCVDCNDAAGANRQKTYMASRNKAGVRLGPGPRTARRLVFWSPYDDDFSGS